MSTTQPPTRGARIVPTALLVLVAGVGLVACGGSDADSGPAAEKDVFDGDPVELTVTTERDTYQLGEPVELSLVLTNHTNRTLRLGVPRIGTDSFTIRVRQGLARATVERIHQRVDKELGQLVPVPNDIQRVGGGETLEATVTTTALVPGEQTWTPQYRWQGGLGIVTAEPLKLRVEAPANRQVGARIVTNQGELQVRLRPDLAYNTVESFVSLVRSGFYDGLTFHRIVRNFMAQGGDPKGDGSGGPGYFLPLEAHEHLPHEKGVLSMARMSPPDTAGSQVFLMFTRRPDLDPGPMGPGYTTFGRVIEGLPVLDRIEELGWEQDGRPPREPVVIESACVELVPAADE